MAFVGAMAAALVLGFLAGLLAFRIKNRWCPACGQTTKALHELHQRHERQAATR